MARYPGIRTQKIGKDCTLIDLLMKAMKAFEGRSTMLAALRDFTRIGHDKSLFKLGTSFVFPVLRPFLYRIG